MPPSSTFSNVISLLCAQKARKRRMRLWSFIQPKKNARSVSYESKVLKKFLNAETGQNNNLEMSAKKNNKMHLQVLGQLLFFSEYL